jgi:hypothetical protein
MQPPRQVLPCPPMLPRGRTQGGREEQPNGAEWEEEEKEARRRNEEGRHPRPSSAIQYRSCLHNAPAHFPLRPPLSPPLHPPPPHLHECLVQPDARRPTRQPLGKQLLRQALRIQQLLVIDAARADGFGGSPVGGHPQEAGSEVEEDCHLRGTHSPEMCVCVCVCVAAIGAAFMGEGCGEECPAACPSPLRHSDLRSEHLPCSVFDLALLCVCPSLAACSVCALALLRRVHVPAHLSLHSHQGYSERPGASAGILGELQRLYEGAGGQPWQNPGIVNPEEAIEPGG